MSNVLGLFSLSHQDTSDNSTVNILHFLIYTYGFVTATKKNTKKQKYSITCSRKWRSLCWKKNQNLMFVREKIIKGVAHSTKILNIHNFTNSSPILTFIAPQFQEFDKVCKIKNKLAHFVFSHKQHKTYARPPLPPKKEKKEKITKPSLWETEIETN